VAIAQRPDLAVETEGLAKRYGSDVVAVDGVDLRIESGTAYALLGPNGAGKTTTVSMLTTLIEPTGGSATVAGHDVVRHAGEVRRRIGVTFQETALEDDLTGRQVLDYHGRLYRLGRRQRREKIEELLALVELEDAADRMCQTYSGGMKRRLELARGLMTEPEVLFLDEPTLGLDVQNRARIWDHIRSLKESGGLTLLLCTHYMDEAEELADRVGIIDQGRIVVEGSPEELVEQMGSDGVRISGSGDSAELIRALRGLPFVETASLAGEFVQIGVDSGSRRLAELVAVAAASDFVIEDVAVAKPGLGDVFLKHTGRRLRDT